jgi:hypothetical protein
MDYRPHSHRERLVRKVVEVLKYNPIDIRLLEPRSRWGDGQPSRACVYVWHGSAREGDIVAVPKGLGSMCFGPLFLATKTPKRIWNSIGYPLRLGEHTAPGPPPLIPDGFLLDLFSLPYGMDRTLTVTLQGIVEDDCSQGSVPYSVMNGVILKIVDF